MTKPIAKGYGASKVNLTPQRKTIIERAARAGCSLNQIACLLGISERALDNWIARPDVNQVYQAAKMNAILNVADMLYNLAISGDLNAIIFYLRCQGRWSPPSNEQAVEASEDHVTIYLPQNGRDNA